MIRFENVTKKYPGTPRPALESINLEVLRGEFVFLVGASGSGKSSCLYLILREEKPTDGTIFVLGNNLALISHRKVPYFRRDIGVVFQDFRLLPNKTVFQNVAFSLQVIGKSRGFIQEAVPDVLEMVGLSNKADRFPNELSGGEQQRVAIARAVVNKPQVLLADEPTGNLDPATSAGIMRILERINAGGTTVVMATHEAGIVDKMQRRVVQLDDGRIVRDERHGGYGDTGIIPELRPESIRGEQVDAARRELAEATRQGDDDAKAAREAHERATRSVEESRADRRTQSVIAGAAASSLAPDTTPGDTPDSDSAQTTAAFAVSDEPSEQPEPIHMSETHEPSVPVRSSVQVESSELIDSSDTAELSDDSHAAFRGPVDDGTPPAASGNDELTQNLNLVDHLGLRKDDDDDESVGPVK